MQYLVDKDGVYIGAYDDESAPDGYTDTGIAPASATQIWLGKKWSEVTQTEDDINREKAAKRKAFRDSSDPVFFKWQRGEATEQEWRDAVKAVEDQYA